MTKHFHEVTFSLADYMKLIIEEEEEKEEET